MEYSENKGLFFSFLYNPILPLLFSNSLLLSSFQLSVANNWYQSHRLLVSKYHESPLLRSRFVPKLLLDKIHNLFDEFNRKLDKSEARWERRDSESQAARAQRVAAVESHVDIPKRIPAAQLDAVVVADFMKVRDLDLSNAPAVAHNWGGLFDGGN